MDPLEVEVRTVEIETIETIQVGDEDPEGAVQLDVSFRNVVFGPSTSADHREKSWFADQLLSRIRVGLGLSVIGARGSVASVTVPRDRMEEAVRTIKSTVEEFRDSFPTVLADHERARQETAEREQTRRQRRAADQELIDRIMNE